LSSSRYSRQSILEEVGQAGQERLKNSKVLIVGAGGLGSPAALYLATAGIGCLGIIDDDVVELSNLGRQVLHGESDLGSSKVESAERSLKAVNPEIEIVVIRDRFREENAAQLVSEYDFVIDGCDNFTTKFLINDSCVLGKKPFSHAGVLGWGGQAFTHIPEEPCYRCLFEEPPPPNVVPNCSEAGVIGPVVGMLGCIQATEAIKYLIGKRTELLLGQLLTVEAMDMKFRKVQFPKNPLCPICGSHPRITELKEDGVAHCDLKTEGSSRSKWLITFEGSQKVLKAERELKKFDLKVEPRVTPRQLSSECGICLQLESHDSTFAKEKLEAKGLKFIRFESI